MGFYVNCPYYKSSAAYGSSTIVCEDTPRDFKTFEKKNEWLEHVCQDDWKSCPFAQGLNGLYERTEKMNLTRKEREHMEYTCKQQKAELVKVKKRMRLAEHKCEQKERDEYAAKHLAKVRTDEVEKLHDKITLLQEQQRGLLALIGFISHKTGISDFTLGQIQRFGRRYETMCRVDTETASDGVEEIKRVYIEHVLKEKDNAADD